MCKGFFADDAGRIYEDDNANYINMTDLVNDGDENVCIDCISSVCHVCSVFVKNA